LALDIDVSPFDNSKMKKEGVVFEVTERTMKDGQYLLVPEVEEGRRVSGKTTAIWKSGPPIERRRSGDVCAR
jgi:hypothetical protein